MSETPNRLAGGGESTRMRWTGPDGGFAETTEADEIWIIDSWLVRDGRVRAQEAHAERFSSACADAFGVSSDSTAAFLRAAIQRIPARGRWFPRVELTGCAGLPTFQLWIRPAPAAGETVRMWIAPGPDRRIRPAVKGIDLDHLAELRQQATIAGADEVLILSADGRVCEGASTSILWWRGDVLYAPPQTPDLLGGVTCAVLLEAVAAAGGRVAYERPIPPELAGLEVWTVNALHGIRPVTKWVGVPIEAGAAHRARHWNAYLDRLVVPSLEGEQRWGGPTIAPPPSDHAESDRRKVRNGSQQPPETAGVRARPPGPTD